MMAGGCAAHSDHGRHLAQALKGVGEGKAPDYRVKDETKLRALAAKLGLENEKSVNELAVAVANSALDVTYSPRFTINTFCRPSKTIHIYDSHHIK
jgi:carbon-monoxide dehydrogenase catalytic subunit